MKTDGAVRTRVRAALVALARSFVRRAGATVLVALAMFITACGYHPLYSGAQGEERLAVTGITPLVADASVVAEVEAGVRAGLARAGLLRGRERASARGGGSPPLRYPK